MTSYRNPKLLALAKHAPRCFCCGNHNDGTVVAIHANMQSMGKGTGIKASDVVAFACHRCHDDIDGRSKFYETRDERNAAWAMGAVHTLRWVLENNPEVFK